MTKKKYAKLSVGFELVGLKEVTEIAGIREAKKGEKGIRVKTVDGIKTFVLDNNLRNRPFSLKTAEEYSEQILAGYWAGQWNSPSRTGSGQSWEIDWNGQIISCVHRCVAVFLAEHKRLLLKHAGQHERIEELGCTKPIKVKALVVRGLDPIVADTSDTGRSRKLDDILFRRHEFAGKTYKESVLKELSKELAVALRLVWLRTQGKVVKSGPKLPHPEALEFLDAHPLLHDAVLHVYEENGGGGAEGRKINNFVSLGYAAASLYLQAFSETSSEELVKGVNFEKKPARWEQAETFWTLFAQDLHQEANAIKSLHKVLGDNRQTDEKLERDAICTLINRAWLSWTGEEEKRWKEPRSLKTALYVKDGDRKVLDFLRVGGIDLEREILDELGVTHDNEILVVVAEEWKKGDLGWVDSRADKVDPWFGKIQYFTDDLSQAAVEDKDGNVYGVPLSQLRADDPETWEEEVEEEEEEATDE